MYFYYKMYTICTLFYNTSLLSFSYVCHYSLRSLTLRLRLTPRNKNAVNLIYADVGNLGIVGIILLIRYWHQYSISDCSHGLLLRQIRIYRKYSHLKHEGLTPISLSRDFFYTFHFVWSCWRMLVRNEVTKGYADSEPDVYRRHGSSMYTGLL